MTCSGVLWSAPPSDPLSSRYRRPSLPDTASELAVLVLEHDRRSVEVGAVGREPVLRLEASPGRARRRCWRGGSGAWRRPWSSRRRSCRRCRSWARHFPPRGRHRCARSSPCCRPSGRAPRRRWARSRTRARSTCRSTPSMKVSDDGRALGGRNGTIGSVIAPSLTRSVRSRPSLPITYSGSTPPNGIGASTCWSAPAAGRRPASRAAAAGRRQPISLSTAAPLPGSPTALFAAAPPPPPSSSKAESASGVRRLGVARSPPGHSQELGGCPPVAAA